MKKDSKKDMNNKKSENPNHKHEIPRLNRAIGQLEGIKKMIEEQRYCPDIIVQLKAVRSAIKHVENVLLSLFLILKSLKKKLWKLKPCLIKCRANE